MGALLSNGTYSLETPLSKSTFLASVLMQGPVSSPLLQSSKPEISSFVKDPASGVGMKIWECFDGLPAQTWYYTDDKRIALLGKGLCLDLPNGVHVNSNQLQTWTCTDGNTNQIWNLPEDLE
ncbi:hypothetical protein H0H87_000503 [Tephrocybe sp. NHM501043]|nr:hypothetical protein H0H87_000503 [Tephrocybe sp. NHM501043]